jgi:hypothetical protein
MKEILMVHRTKEQWAEMVADFRGSGMTQTSWCREHGINVKTFQNHVSGKKSQKNLGHRNNSEWSALIQRYGDSGKSRRAWCNENGINESAMISAERRINRKGSDPASTRCNVGRSNFVKAVPTVSAEPIYRGHVRISADGIEVEADGGYPVEKLYALIEKVASR